jgi:hypothetical protein
VFGTRNVSGPYRQRSERARQAIDQVQVLARDVLVPYGRELCSASPGNLRRCLDTLPGAVYLIDRHVAHVTPPQLIGGPSVPRLVERSMRLRHGHDIEPKVKFNRVVNNVRCGTACRSL